MFTLNVKMCLSTLSFLILITLSTTLKISTCKCPNREHCHYNGPDSKETSNTKEVIVVTNGSSDFKAWNWDTLTTVFTTSGSENTDIMCHAHSLDKKYGVIVDLPAFKNLTVTNSEVTAWVKDFPKSIQNADIVVLNLMPFIMENAKEDITSLLALLPVLKKLIHLPNTMDCIVPWKPIVSDAQVNSIAWTMGESCDRFILSPDSYMHIDGYSCKARATIPITKLVLGVDEYVTEGITEDRLIVGVPWHGYNYPCESFNETNMVCKLKSVNGTCDVMTREKLTLADMLSRPEIHLFHADEWNEAYKAPFHIFVENTSSGELYHQLWYEDVESLRVKYTLVKDLQLKGLAVYTAEDLTSSSTSSSIVDFDTAMWSWILHDLLNKGKVRPRGTAKYYYASTVTGVAIGCLFGGVLLGVIFTCIAFRKIEKKKLPPFTKDLVQDDYHDDIDL